MNCPPNPGQQDEGYFFMKYTLEFKLECIEKYKKGNCIDNCVTETFFWTLKREMFYGHEGEFRTFEQLKRAIAEYIDYYNNRRIKGKTKWMPPAVYREASMRAL